MHPNNLTQTRRQPMRCSVFTLVAVLALTLLWATGAQAVRIKDIADIKGVRNNQLVGYGLVVGLDGTGDGKKSKFTIQSLASMLEKMGVTVNPDDIAVSNVAAVMVTAELPPFARSGGRIDALVNSIGDAENLQGGTLLLTPLKAVNGNVYAVAQGPVNTGGFSASGAGGKAQKNFPTVGRVVGGALIEREVVNDFNARRKLTLALHQPDFTTVARVTDAINGVFYGNIARAPDAGTVEVQVPEKYINNVVSLVALLEGLSVTPDQMAKVVINERTGTVVMGDQVRISTIAIAHGNLSIVIKEGVDVSQPAPFSEGETIVAPNTSISVQEDDNRLVVLNEGVSIGEVVKALNALGVTPRDLVAIFQAIKAAGALQAELEVI
ncbi:MAG: flagellar basal body P-ring protein FlgI [Desulfosarcinaceae bacterium]|nr:flagellar basal body P-ring protein FlgI [Desulfosarcinaceae bacterium]